MQLAPYEPLTDLVVVYAPIGRDGELTERLLRSKGHATRLAKSLAELCGAIEDGVALAVITEEAVSGPGTHELRAALEKQPIWSALPIVLCATGGDVMHSQAHRSGALADLGNVIVVERPMQTRTFFAAVQAGLRARRHQFELSRVVQDLERAAKERSELLERAEAARQAEQQASRAKDEFMAMISHELRTPLNAILGWSHMLIEDKLDDNQRHRAIRTIARNAEAQARLIEELLDVSRIISRKLELSRRAVELSRIVEHAAETMRPQANEKGVTLSVSVATRTSNVMGDADRLTQIVSNLIGNAIKFTPKGGRVDVELRDADASTLRLVVRDDGIGIREEFLPYVFEAFRQADGSRTRSHGGLGLGLAIVRHLVELHGGEVRAWSRGIGTGAEFSISLPRIAATDARLPSERPNMNPTLALAGVHVVVVDDEPDARDLVTTALELAGASVTSVGSADEAMHAISQHPPALLVSDIGMPGEDGYALIARVRALPPDCGGRVPALAVTAFTRPSDRARAIDAGYTAHVGKPINPFELVSLARKVCVVEQGAQRAP